jgi:hypothetical protein
MQAVVELRTPGVGGRTASWSNRRQDERLPADLKANLRARGSGVRVKAEVVDISVTGCGLLTRDYRPGDQLLVTIAHLAPVPAEVCWVRNGAAGLQFASRLHPSIVSHLGAL